MPRPSSIPQAVWSRIGRNLHLIPNHPIGIVSGLIHSHFPSAVSLSFPDPVVTTQQAFDDLLVPKEHPLRSRSDTFYTDKAHVLRPHATSHQSEVLGRIKTGTAVWTCDVYRKDEVDRIHFPVFHQTDGIRLFDPQVGSDEVVADLKTNLEALIRKLGGRELECRWDESASFPFTSPSLELEVRDANDRWLEVLGCGKIRSELHPNGWAFGIGLDRLAMLLFGIEDIRTLWSEDERFLSQFKAGEISTFKPFSKFPPIYRDTAFFLPQHTPFDVHQFDLECMRRAGPSGLEKVELRDVFAKNDQISRCFRFVYRGIESTLTNAQTNEIHNELIVAKFLEAKLAAQVRH